MHYRKAWFWFREQIYEYCLCRSACSLIRRKIALASLRNCSAYVLGVFYVA